MRCSKVEYDIFRSGELSLLSKKTWTSFKQSLRFPPSWLCTLWVTFIEWNCPPYSEPLESTNVLRCGWIYIEVLTLSSNDCWCTTKIPNPFRSTQKFWTSDLSLLVFCQNSLPWEDHALAVDLHSPACPRKTYRHFSIPLESFVRRMLIGFVQVDIQAVFDVTGKLVNDCKNFTSCTQNKAETFQAQEVYKQRRV